MKRTILAILTILISFDLYAELAVWRLNDSQPIVDNSHFDSLGISDQGENINGPSVIRIPDWVSTKADPSAQYYMYFASHNGNYIRLAWASDIEGTWTLFNAGTNDNNQFNGYGVLDLGSMDQIMHPGGASVSTHIASPDVIIDDINQQFIMYFHGYSNSTTPGDNEFSSPYQKTFVATSESGLNFNNPDGTVIGGVGGGEPGHGVKNVILGDYYFRTFTFDGGLYAFTNFGPIWKAPNIDIPWQPANPVTDDAWQEGPNPVFDDLAQNYPRPERHEAGNSNPKIGAPRHFAVHKQNDGNTLEVWYTSRGDKPERIFQTSIDLSANDWLNWDSEVTNPNTVHNEMLRPEFEWEGACINEEVSEDGSAVNVNQLRDPALFTDLDGKRYLFYSGAGETAIGAARIINEEDAPIKLPVAGVSYSDYEPGNPGENTQDGDLDTRWSSNEYGATLTLDLNSVSTVTEVRIAAYKGDSRVAYFDLQVLVDGNWTSLAASPSLFSSCGNTLNLQRYDFPDTDTRYIRLVGYGNTINNWNSFTEIEVWGVPGDTPPPIEKLPVAGVTTSNAQPGNPGENTQDGNLDTRWSSDDYAATLTLDLNSESTVTEVRIAAYKGDARVAYFDLQAFVDGSWVILGSYQTSGTTLQLQTFDVPDTQTRYIRLIGYGNSINNWNSFTEIEAWGVPGDTPPPIEKLPVAGVTVSSAQTGNPGENTQDGSLDTRWSSDEYGATLTLDLYSVNTVTEVRIAAHKGDSRVAYFDLQAFVDGSWVILGSYQTSGTTLQLQRFNVPDTQTRYVRLVGYGNTINNWNSFTEIEVWGMPGEPPPPTEKLTVAGVTTSNAQPGNPGENTQDGDLDTRWSSDDHGATLTLDLNSDSTVTEVRIAAYKGDARVAYFDLQAFVDGSWVTLGSYQTSGTTLQLQSFNVPDTQTRFVRLIGYGNTVNNWNSFTEIEVYGLAQ